jgi:hypothetical protein
MAIGAEAKMNQPDPQQYIVLPKEEALLGARVGADRDLKAARERQRSKSVRFGSCDVLRFALMIVELRHPLHVQRREHNARHPQRRIH